MVFAVCPSCPAKRHPCAAKRMVYPCSSVNLHPCPLVCRLLGWPCYRERGYGSSIYGCGPGVPASVNAMVGPRDAAKNILLLSWHAHGP
eukprot:jgi/Mesvir1/12103/Mv26257-RA.1